MTIEYNQFPLSNYLSCNLLTSLDINKLKDNSKMLSVGVGIGTYESHLISEFKVPQSSIYCADVNLDKKWVGPNGFEFDIKRTWPTFDVQFDYILFGQVIGVSANEGKPIPRSAMLDHVYHIIDQASINLTKNGKILIYDTTLPAAITGPADDATPLFTEISNALGGRIINSDHLGTQLVISF